MIFDGTAILLASVVATAGTVAAAAASVVAGDAAVGAGAAVVAGAASAAAAESSSSPHAAAPMTRMSPATTPSNRLRMKFLHFGRTSGSPAARPAHRPCLEGLVVAHGRSTGLVLITSGTTVAGQPRDLTGLRTNVQSRHYTRAPSPKLPGVTTEHDQLAPTEDPRPD